MNFSTNVTNGVKLKICMLETIRDINITYDLEEMTFRSVNLLTKESTISKTDKEGVFMIDDAFDIDIGYWKIGKQDQEHLNHTGPLYSGPLDTIYYNRDSKAIEVKQEHFTFWGLNFG